MRYRIIAFALFLVLLLPTLLSISGCGTRVQAQDLMSDIKADNKDTDIDITGFHASAITDFGVKLFQGSIEEGKNTLISPLSVISALAMTANGAKGETLSQMEDTFGLPVSQLNEYLCAYKASLASDDKYKLSLANSIWFKDDDSFVVKPDFLQINADWYGAGIFKAPFDSSTLKDINSWVSDNTNGMTKDILDEIPGEAIMYLVNALSFDAEWQNIYKENEVKKSVFTTQDGIAKDVDLMYSQEGKYLEDKNATGFIKYYADRKYAFAALLPNEGVSIEDYAATLNGERLHNILSNAKSATVNAATPKFKCEYDLEMNDLLKSLGIINAFDSGIADFSGLGSSTQGNIYIGRVLHKTFIAVDEKGTKAGAATVVEMKDESAIWEPDDIKTVYLDRPFVYMLIDCKANLPFFIGTVMDPSLT